MSRIIILLLCFLYFVHTVPIPKVSLALSKTQGRVGESVIFSVSFDNIGTKIGYGPYVDLILPVNATSWLSAFSPASSATTTLDVQQTIQPKILSFSSKTLQPASERYCVTHPITQSSVCMYGGYSLYIFEFPLMSYSPAQTELKLSFSSTIIAFSNSSFADITTYARGGFRYSTTSASGTFCCSTTSDTQVNAYSWSVYVTFKAVFWYGEFSAVAIPWSKSSLFANESVSLMEYYSTYEWLVNTGIRIKNCTFVFEIPPCMILYLDAWNLTTMSWLTSNNSVVIIAALSSNGSIKSASEFAFPVQEFSRVFGPAKVLLRILDHVGDGVKKVVPLKYGIDKDCINLWNCNGDHLVLSNTQTNNDWFNWVVPQNLDYSGFITNSSLVVNATSQLNVTEEGNRTTCCIDSYCPGGFYLNIAGSIFGYCLCNSSYSANFTQGSNSSWIQIANKVQYQSASVQSGLSYLSMAIKLAAQANGSYCITNYVSVFDEALGEAWQFLFPLWLNNTLSDRWILQPIVGTPKWTIDNTSTEVISLNTSLSQVMSNNSLTANLTSMSSISGTVTLASGPYCVARGELILECEGIMVNGEAGINLVNANSTSNETVTASASASVDTGRTLHRVYAVDGTICYNGTSSNMNANCIAGGGSYLFASQVVTYEVIQFVTTSSVDELCFTIFPPFPVFNITNVTAAFSSPSNKIPEVNKLTFGASETLAPFFNVTPTIEKDVVSNMLKVCYGNLNDKFKTARVVDLLYTVQVTSNPYPDNLPIASMATMYTKTCGSRNGWNRILLAQPSLTISKSIVYINSTTGKINSAPSTTFSVAGSAGFRASKAVTSTLTISNVATAQGEDILSFALVISNIGHGTAYGTYVVDSYDPTYMKLVNGGNIFISNGLSNLSDTSGNLFSGLRISQLPGLLSGQNDNLTYGNTVAGKNIILITFDVQMSSLVESGCTYNNQFILMNYWPTTNYASSAFLTSNVTVTSPVKMNSITMKGTPNKSVITIGETVTTRICVTFVHHGFVRSGSTLTIDNGSQGTSRKKLTRVGDLQIGSSLTIGSVSQQYLSYSNDAIRDGVKYTFGNITYNSGMSANGTVNVDDLCVEVDYQIWNQAGFVNGSTTTVKASFAFPAYCRTTTTTVSTTQNIRVIEPFLTVSAIANASSVQNGDVVEYVVMIRHSGSSSSTAYNIDLCGSFANQVYIPNSLSMISPSSLQYNNSLNIVQFNSSFGLTTTSTIVVKLQTMVTNLTLGQAIAYNVCVTWDSYLAFPLAVNETIPWRSYSQTSTVTIPSVGLPKGSLLASESKLVYGQCASLEFMSQALPQARMDNVQLILTMSNQLDYVPQTLQLTSSSPSTLYSTLANDWDSVAAIANANLVRGTANGSPTVTFSLGTVINADFNKTITELLTANVKVDIASGATISSGSFLSANLTIVADGVSAQVTNEIHILVQEPQLTLLLRGSPVNSKICQQQQYQFSVLHSSSSTATAYSVLCSFVMDGEWALAKYGGPGAPTFNFEYLQSTDQLYPDYKITVSWDSIALHDRRDFFIEGWARSTMQGLVITGPQMNCTWASLPLNAAQTAPNNTQSQSPPTCRQNPFIKTYGSINPYASLPIAPDDLTNYKLGYCGLGSVNPIFSRVPSLFNALVFDDFIATQSDIEGRLAAGGNVKLSQYGVTQNLDWDRSDDKTVTSFLLAQRCTDLAQDEWAYNLVARKNILWENGGQMFLGHIVYGDQSGTYIDWRVYDTVMTRQCKVSYWPNTDANFPVDFSTAKAYLSSLSISLALLTPNGLVTNKWGNLAVTITQGLSPVVLNIDGLQLLQAQSIYFESGPPAINTTLIINVSGRIAGLVNMGLMYTSVDYKALQHTLWNFYDATTLVFHGVGVPGTVLAPKAKILGESSVLFGHMFSRAFLGTMQINQRAFQGCVPCPNFADCCPNKSMM